MIGRIRCRDKNAWEATMEDNGTWTSPEPVFAFVLNADFSPRTNCSPADGVFGYRMLHEAAKKWNAEVFSEPPKPGRKARPGEEIVY
jgi:hypothetical protein